ncbi:MAG: glycosyltransferase family 2 protein, partial [Marinoscillum sp.]
STDRSGEICRQFLVERIEYFEQENQGVSVARNLALDHSSGEFICFLDADDQLTSTSLETRLKLFDDPTVMFVDGVIEIRDGDFIRVKERRIQTYSGIPLAGLLNIDNSVFFGPSWMIRKKTGVTYRFKEGLTHGEDLLFYISIGHLGKYQAVKEVVYIYRQGNVSAMSDLDGLWSGYKTILKELSTLPTVNRNEGQIFKKKITSIMFKSYLGFAQPSKALGVLRDYFRI